ncbi:right-handed parallel beta-helix repeat-containing protein [Chryseobacterium sp. MFBS3-17]|uniref:right-handed parallel beta-helix repeat-containing protein n=1 Tax=Chryseobacterium sp. MFBS3-17 TaxID=2886689 RepID=UPI001D0DD225|nr:right-handed parallel beta-helix repeat-containing protein [Chryseobacterium sp. MFBS3-17]MCC2591360.1 right-handed parallel beta-helix repeat-containing protein [Chryseobacterium sp. MFBS3-17]
MTFSKYLILLLLIFNFSLVIAQDKIPAQYNFYSNSYSTNLKSNLEKRINKNQKGEESTRIIQDYIDKNKEIILPNKEIYISKKGLFLKDNSTIIFQKYTKLVMESNDLERYGVINVINVNNVKIINPNIIGDRKSHTGNKGEWGHGINILGSKNVLISNFNISNCWGDGIYIGRDNNKFSSNITLKNGIVYNNRRNGISITSVDGLLMNNITSAFNQGTSPQYGIDFEANDSRDEMNNIKLNNIITYYNKSGGMMISFDRLNAKGSKTVTKEVNFEVTNFKDIGSKNTGLLIAQITSGFKNIKGGITFNGLEVEGNLKPIQIRRNEWEHFYIKLNDVNIKNPLNKNAHNKELLRVTKDRKNIIINLAK